MSDPLPIAGRSSGGRAWLLFGGVWFVLAAACLIEPSAGLAADAETLERLPLLSRLAAAMSELASGRGAILLAVLALLTASALAARALEGRLGGGAPGAVACLIAGSALTVRLGAGDGVVLVAAVVILAFSLVAWRPRRASEIPDLYQTDLDSSDVYDPDHLSDDLYEEEPVTTAFGWVRWLVAGLGLGLVATHDPLYALLLLPAAAFAPHGARKRAAVVAVSSAAIVVLLVSWMAPTALWAGVAQQTDLSVGALANPQMIGWNGLYWLAGRSAGLLVTCVAALLLLWRPGSSKGGSSLASRALVGVFLGANALAVVTRPFGFSGAEAGFGSAFLLPLFVALWFARERRLPPLLLAVVSVLGLAVGLPWWGGGVAKLLPTHAVARVASLTVDRLPSEITQTELPCGHSKSGKEFSVRWLDCESANAGPANTGPAVVAGYAEVAVASDRALDRLYLRFGRSAPNDLTVRGATLENTIFRPNGGIDFELSVGRPRSHGVGWAPESDRVYVFQLSMPVSTERAGFEIRDAGEGWRSEIER